MKRSIITRPEQLQDLVDHYLSAEAFVFDVETIGEDRKTPLLADVRWLSLCSGDRSDTIPMGHPNGELLYERQKLSTKGRERMARGIAREDLNPKYDFVKELERGFGPPPDQLSRFEVFEALRPLFFGDSLKIAHNIKYDLHAIAKYYSGEYPEGPYFDTMLVSWLLDVSRRGRLSLKDCVKRECGIEMEKGVGEDISQHPFSVVAEYSVIDAECTWDLWSALKDQCYRKSNDEGGRFRWLRDLEMELLRPVLEMESTGVRIDLGVLGDLDEKMREDMDILRDMVYVDFQRVFNVQSVREKQEILFLKKASGGKGFRPIKLTPSAVGRDEGTHTIYDYSVDAETLEHYRDDHGVRMLLSYLAKNKIHNTYVLPYFGGHRVKGDGTEGSYIVSKLRNGRVYGRFQQHGTDSGRFSSSDPNLQNIPSRTAEGKLIRSIFVPSEGMDLITADYSQIEPRIIAALSGDPVLVNTYREGGDVYQVVGDRVGVVRRSGKELVLAISYGVGADKIASRIGCSPTEARDLLDYFAVKFSAVPRYKRRVVAKASKNGYAETVLGRRRPLPDLRSGDFSLRSAAERQAFNHRIQGTAADIMKVALVNMWYDLPEGARLLMTVHDEVVVEAPHNLVQETVEVIRTAMEGAAPSVLDVPFVADIKVSSSWMEGKA